MVEPRVFSFYFKTEGAVYKLFRWVRFIGVAFISEGFALD